MDRWDNYFLSLADVCAKQSKDPSTKVGAICADRFDRVISSGFNGLPRGIKDKSNILKDRKIKYMVILHAEVNAILFAKRDLTGCKLYSTHVPCSNCASIIIQAGIDEVVAGIDPDSTFTDRWNESLEITKSLFKEAGIKLRLIER